MKKFAEKCRKCNGSGTVHFGWTMSYSGVCFRCNGTGKKWFKTSPEVRAANRAKAKAKRQAAYEAKLQAQRDANGGLTNSELYHKRKAEREAQWAAEKEAKRQAAQPVPTGRILVSGKVLATKLKDSQWGLQWKMLVEDERGFNLWGSVPKSIINEDVDGCGLSRGDLVTFTATVEPSKDDNKFGFFSRPTKATATQAVQQAA